MHIRKFDFDYGRRALMEKVAKGTLGAGVLASAWPLVAEGNDIQKAYPDELTSIEMNTKGKIKPGDTVTAENVEHIKHLLDPIVYHNIKNEGRKIHIVEPSPVTDMFPPAYLEATVKNQGRGGFDKNNNVIDTKTGGKWIGGSPFPDPKTGLEAIANLTLSWGRHDYSQYAIRDVDLNPDGSIGYEYDFVWAELNTTVRLGKDKVFKNFDDMLRLQNVWFTSPGEQAGTSFLSEWYYDQRKFPEQYSYLPLFKRVRRFPANQRFEPLVPGINLYLSDAWGAGDPMLTWGNYKVVGVEPHLTAVSPKNWEPTWEQSVHGGPQGQTFYDFYYELAPECIVFEAEPTGYPRAPVGKKKIWQDVRNQMIIAYITYDRKGDVWKSVEPAFGPKDVTDPNGNRVRLTDKQGRTEWSGHRFHFYDLQERRMSRFDFHAEVAGGYKTKVFAEDEEEVYDDYLTRSALNRLGSI